MKGEGYVRMDGWDMREVGVYKEKEEHWEKDRDTGIKEREAQKRMRERERIVNSVTICINLASSGKLVEGEIPLYFVRLTLSSLSWSSSRVPSCCSFPSLTNSINLGQSLTV